MNTDLFTIEMLKKGIQTAHKYGVSWRKIGLEYGITGGMAYRIAHGYEPREAHIRHTLHLPALVEVAPCSKCGEIHLRRTCPTKTKPRAPRIAVRLDDPERAAATLLTHAPAGYVARLVELLNVERRYHE